MNVFLWIVAAVLAATFLGSGAMKLLTSTEKLTTLGLGWAEDVGTGMVKAIGVLELLAAAGLTLPPLLGIAPVLAPLAAIGLVLLMLGAALTHLRRKEPQGIAVSLTLAVLAITVAWGRLGPYPFGA
ncbi:DoxX-like protein [Murinocardiopsis flavida]|uniref:DoxX-like protein n=1 Tax=Murinocardiopsis flavida TaxID=645275 RepID=A0A2P8D910_9ACTN|nr:DoxX family protein [Murinocardiopsis flavida]PSK93693.1 DoxX-like protein [Murinocardiopsis flavida]